MTEILSFTALSDEFMAALLKRQQESQDEYGSNSYPITLNTTDFEVFTKILRSLAQYGGVSHKDFEIIPGFSSEEEEPISQWAWDWLSGIGETLGVEGI